MVGLEALEALLLMPAGPVDKQGAVQNFAVQILQFVSCSQCRCSESIATSRRKAWVHWTGIAIRVDTRFCKPHPYPDKSQRYARVGRRLSALSAVRQIGIKDAS